MLAIELARQQGLQVFVMQTPWTGFLARRSGQEEEKIQVALAQEGRSNVEVGPGCSTRGKGRFARTRV